ncbi:MAG: hypothetical protein IJW29_08175 [Clostridia bacterium]|nr:hypothetical protein [Clostridia bacterium]
MPNSRTPRIIGRVIKILFTLLIFSVCAILLWRVCASGDPKTVDRMIVNEALANAYEKHGDDLLLRYQNQNTITQDKHNSGYFSVTQYVFIPEAEQVQLVFRYNKSTLEKVSKDKDLDKVPDKDEDLFDVTLVVVTDLTPDDKKDNEKGENLLRVRVESSAHVKDTESKRLYTYYRYVFDGITLPENTVGVYAEIYYVPEINGYEGEPYGSLCLYDTEHKWFEEKLSRADKKAIEAWIEDHK